MFRSTTIIRELVLNLAKVIFMLKHSVKLRRYILFGDVAAHAATSYEVRNTLPGDHILPPACCLESANKPFVGLS
jgi:hypothetical protein